MLPDLRTAWEEEFAKTGDGTFYVGCNAFDPVRALAHVIDGRCQYVTIHGIAGPGVCYTLNIPGNPSPW